MLYLLYGFNTPRAKEIFKNKVSNFFRDCTQYQETMIDGGDCISISIFNLPCGYCALDIIHSIDCITDTNDIECCLLQFCYTDKDIYKYNQQQEETSC